MNVNNLFFLSCKKPPSPYINRFLSPDTIVPGAANPQAYNRYSYVLGNPLRYTDPTGHYCVGDDEDCADEGGTGPAPSGNGGSTTTGGGGGGDPHDDDDYDPNPNGVSGRNEDTGPITDAILNLPFSDDVYNGAATTFDSIAWLTDLFAAGVVTYGAVYGAGLAIPFTVVGGPAVPTVTGFAGAVIAEFYVQPILTVGNVFASLSTASTVIADTKAGTTRIDDGVFSSSVSNSIILTAAGWANKEAYLSIAIQSVALTNDFGWTSLPFQPNP